MPDSPVSAGAGSAAAPSTDGPPPDLARPYGFARGFSYRREAFGGILYHYEGVQPDPRVTFVDNGFLLDLLDALAAHPDTPPSELVEAVAGRFALDAAERERVQDFFATLIARGALVPR